MWYTLLYGIRISFSTRILCTVHIGCALIIGFVQPVIIALLTINTKLAKFAQGDVKLHFREGGPIVQKFNETIVNFYFGSTYQQFQLL